MKCSMCKKNEAVIYIREYSDRGLKKINLCLECALEKGFNATIGDINKLFKNLIKNIFNIKDKKGTSRVNHKVINLTCPACKKSVNQLAEEGKAGCPTCYTMFEQVIDLMVFKHNNSLYYRGKLPSHLKNMKNNRAMLFKLKKELKKKINLEDFNNAAIIRDKIKAVKKEIEKEVRQFANKQLK